MQLVLRRAIAFLCCLFATLPTTSRALSWENIGPDGGGIEGYAQSPTNPDRLYCLLPKNGLHRSDDRGANWARVDTGLPASLLLRAIGVSSMNPDLLLVAPSSGASILRSTDAGETWTTIPLGAGAGNFAFDPTDGERVLASVVTGPPIGVHRSTDAGVTWSLSNVGLGSATGPIAFDPLDSNHVLVATGVGIFASTDGGATWLPSDTGGAVAGPISFCEANPDIVWSSTYPGGVLRSTNGGTSFLALGPPSQCDPSICDVRAVLGGVVNENEVLCAKQRVTGIDAFFCRLTVQRSTDAGMSWTAGDTFYEDKFDNQRITGFSRDPQFGGTLFIGFKSSSMSVNDGFQTSTDSGATWGPSIRGLRGLSVFETECDSFGNVYLRESRSEGLWRDAEDEEWVELDPPVDETLTLFAANEQREGVLYEGGSYLQFDVEIPLFFRSTDFGVKWQVGIVNQVDLFQRPRLVAPSASGTILYLWCDYESFAEALYRSTDAGLTFDAVSEGDPTPADAIVSWDSPQHIFAILADASGDVRLSTDGGVTWEPRSAGLPSDAGVALFQGAPSPGGQPAELIAVYRQSGAFRSTNAGLAWSAVPLSGYSGEPVVDADWDRDSGHFCFATTAQGVFRSELGFVTDGLYAPELTSIDFVGSTGKIVVGTRNASAFLLDPQAAVAVPTLVGSSSAIQILARPNPTRGATELQFTLPGAASRIRITIVDVTGRRVRTLFEGARAAGSHASTWDGKAESGRRVSPGNYFARLEVDGDVASARVTVLTD